MLAPPIRSAGVPAPMSPAPQLGADTDAFLEEVGVSAAEREQLRTHKII